VRNENFELQIIRDGASRIGRIWFTWAQGSDLDCNAKTWRLIADILNDVALFLELLIGVFPTYFLLLASIGSSFSLSLFFSFSLSFFFLKRKTDNAISHIE
jgi:hypothetical protein